MIRNLSIHGLRGFGERRVINFAIPCGEPGSGITFLVGSNNSGKTTILEALRSFNSYQHDPPSFSEGKRNKKYMGGKIHLSIETDNGFEYHIDTVEHGGSPTMLNKVGHLGSGWDPPSIFVLQARRNVEHEFHHNELNRDDYIRNEQSSYFNRSAALREFNARLFKMHSHKRDFDLVLKKILGYDLDWAIERRDNGMFYLKLFLGECEHSSEGMGDGIWSVFTICDSLYDSKPGEIIAIDEPELSLHPAYQKKTLALLKEYSKNRQIIISTHSPYFIEIESLTKGARLFRTVKNFDGNIDIFCISKESGDNLSRLVKDLNQPHTLGMEAKEIFFLEDGIILVEGQEDVIMYTLAAESLGIRLNGSFFGWGAGGAEKMPKILKVLQELGYRKVAVILDGDKPQEKDTLMKQYPQYGIFNISQSDIRDKREIKPKAKKSGLMTSNGTLKDEYRSEMSTLLQEINQCLEGGLIPG